VDRKRYRKQIIISLALFGFSLFYLLSTLRLKMGTPRNMGPGFVPAMLGVLLLASTGFHLIRVYRGRPSGEETDQSPEEAKNYWAVAGILVCTAAYPLILETMKFVTSTFSWFAMLLLLKPKNLVFSFLFSLGLWCFSFLSLLRSATSGFQASFPMGVTRGDHTGTPRRIQCSVETPLPLLRTRGNDSGDDHRSASRPGASRCHGDPALLHP
jgi:uncharacterized protein (DUF486 family)